jgi:hypothetical protein
MFALFFLKRGVDNAKEVSISTLIASFGGRRLKQASRYQKNIISTVFSVAETKLSLPSQSDVPLPGHTGHRTRYDVPARLHFEENDINLRPQAVGKISARTGW